METLTDLQDTLLVFRDARGWARYHTPAHLARALMVEAGELNALYLWGGEPAETRAMDEVADVLIYALNFCNAMGWSAAEIIQRKVDKNAVRYPEGLCRPTETS